MDLYCEKYRATVEAEGAICHHPKEYCKFRTACIIHLMSSAFGEQENLPKKDKSTMNVLNFSKGVEGLLPAIVQDYQSNDVLMLAYINQESWLKTLETGKAHYWSRSRKSLWLKGETSGHVQRIQEILIDCDADTVVFKVEQVGGAACHTGHRSCFYRRVEETELKETEGLVFDPREVYKK